MKDSDASAVWKALGVLAIILGLGMVALMLIVLDANSDRGKLKTRLEISDARVEQLQDEFHRLGIAVPPVPTTTTTITPALRTTPTTRRTTRTTSPTSPPTTAPPQTAPPTTTTTRPLIGICVPRAFC